MSLRLKMLYSACAGAWGGMIAWILLDPLLRWQASNHYLDAIVNGAIIGICVGTFIIGFEGLSERSLGTLRRRVLGGLAAGLIGGTAGLLLGEVLFQLLGQQPWARMAGWALFGAAIGASEGLLVQSWRRVMLGGIGGVIGGLAGSAIFLAVRTWLDLPVFSRALGFTLLGALIGLLIGFVPVVSGEIFGRLKVVSSGRNEGKEIPLDKSVTLIGASDRCDLCLYGRADVQPQHAEVRRIAQGYIIQPASAAAVLVNGTPVTRQKLQDGDRIRLGSEEVVYRGAS